MLKQANGLRESAGAPRAGAWIETLPRLRTPYMSGVERRHGAGAWIENWH